MKNCLLFFGCCSLFIVHCSFLTGCGYRTLADNHQTIAVPIFENKTVYHGHEFEFTRLVHQRILAQTPWLLTDHQDQADFLLSGELMNYTRPALIEGVDDQVIVSRVAITLRIVLTDLKTGKTIYEGSRTESGSLISMRGQTEVSARAEVFNKLARWVTASVTTEMVTNNMNR